MSNASVRMPYCINPIGYKQRFLAKLGMTWERQAHQELGRRAPSFISDLPLCPFQVCYVVAELFASCPPTPLKTLSLSARAAPASPPPSTPRAPTLRRS